MIESILNRKGNLVTCFHCLENVRLGFDYNKHNHINLNGFCICNDDLVITYDFVISTNEIFIRISPKDYIDQNGHVEFSICILEENNTIYFKEYGSDKYSESSVEYIKSYLANINNLVNKIMQNQIFN